MLSDQLLLDVGFVPALLHRQMFFIVDNAAVTVVLAKIVEDLLVAGMTGRVDPLLQRIDDRFILGTVAHGTGHIRFFWLNISQLDEWSISVDSDDKLNAIDTLPLSRFSHHDTASP